MCDGQCIYHGLWIFSCLMLWLAVDIFIYILLFQVKMNPNAALSSLPFLVKAIASWHVRYINIDIFLLHREIEEWFFQLLICCFIDPRKLKARICKMKYVRCCMGINRSAVPQYYYLPFTLFFREFLKKIMPLSIHIKRKRFFIRGKLKRDNDIQKEVFTTTMILDNKALNWTLQLYAYISVHWFPLSRKGEASNIFV